MLKHLCKICMIKDDIFRSGNQANVFSSRIREAQRSSSELFNIVCLNLFKFFVLCYLWVVILWIALNILWEVMFMTVLGDEIVNAANIFSRWRTLSDTVADTVTDTVTDMDTVTYTVTDTDTVTYTVADKVPMTVTDTVVTDTVTDPVTDNATYRSRLLSRTQSLSHHLHLSPHFASLRFRHHYIFTFPRSLHLTPVRSVSRKVRWDEMKWSLKRSEVSVSATKSVTSPCGPVRYFDEPRVTER